MGSKKNPILRIEFLATDMADDYEHDSALGVLKNVMSGYRGVPGYWIQPWSASYYGKYFSYSGPSMIAAYDKFIELRDKQLKRNEETYKKYMYALNLRMEAVEHIGIDNIRLSRQKKLAKEKSVIEERYKRGKQLYPDFKLMMLIRLEA